MVMDQTTNSSSFFLKTEPLAIVKRRSLRIFAGDACGRGKREGNGRVTIEVLERFNVLSKLNSR